MQSRKKITPILTGGPISAYDEEGANRKRTFHREARAFLKALAADIGLLPGRYDLRNNPGGMAVSGEVTLHADRLYVQVTKSGGCDILYRRCDSREDCHGGCNHGVSFADLLDADTLHAFLVHCRELAGLVPDEPGLAGHLVQPGRVGG
jgi:hypothetical protein